MANEPVRRTYLWPPPDPIYLEWWAKAKLPGLRARAEILRERLARMAPAPASQGAQAVIRGKGEPSDPTARAAQRRIDLAPRLFAELQEIEGELAEWERAKASLRPELRQLIEVRYEQRRSVGEACNLLAYSRVTLWRMTSVAFEQMWVELR